MHQLHRPSCQVIASSPLDEEAKSIKKTKDQAARKRRAPHGAKAMNKQTPKTLELGGLDVSVGLERGIASVTALIEHHRVVIVVRNR